MYILPTYSLSIPNSIDFYEQKIRFQLDLWIEHSTTLGNFQNTNEFLFQLLYCSFKT